MKKVIVVEEPNQIERIVSIQGTNKIGFHYQDNQKYFVIDGKPLINIAYEESDNPIYLDTVVKNNLGIDEINNRELNILRENFNQDFISLNKSIEDLEPLLNMFTTGEYQISDEVVYPISTNGEFFWNYENLFNKRPYDLYYQEFIHHQEIIYTRALANINTYNEERVKYYQKNLNKGYNNPRAVLFKYSEYEALVLDGHHKICACLLNKEPVRAIVIKPLSNMKTDYVVDNFNELSNKTIKTDRYWDSLYLDAKYNYVSLDLLGQINASLDRSASITEFTACKLINLFNEDREQAKQYAFNLLNDKNSDINQETVFTILSNYQDELIKDIFVNYIMEHYEEQDRCYKVAENYLKNY